MTDIHLDHILIAVRDLDRTPKIFGHDLGFKVTPEGVHHGRGTHNRLIVFGPEYLELISIRDPTEGVFRPNMVTFLESREGLFIFALGTPDIDRAVAGLRNRGVAVEEPISGARNAEDGTAAYSWRQAAIDTGATPGSQTFFIQHRLTIAERYTEPEEPANHPNGALGIAHLELAVSDADEASSRWRRAFGFGVVSSQGAPADEEVKRVRLELRNCYLDFVSPLGPGPLSRFLEQHGDAPYRLALRVRDLTATADFLSRRGVRASSLGGDASAAVMVDPAHANGVALTLVQQASRKVDRGLD